MKSENLHGGNIWALAQTRGVDPQQIYDLSSNVAEFNAVFDDDRWLQSEALSRLPEPFALTLRQQIAEHYSLTLEHVWCGNGSTELLHLVFDYFRQTSVLLFHPSYNDYRKYARLCRLREVSIVLRAEEEFRVDLQQLHDCCHQVALVVLCNPNNPTGGLLPRSELLACVADHPWTVFLVDESYLPFLSNEAELTLLAESLPNLIILRSFSKITGLPGIRLGWMHTGNAGLLEFVESWLSPWSINGCAQALGARLLRQDCSAMQRQTQQTRDDFLPQLQSLSQVNVFPTEANFVLLQHKTLKADEIARRCATQNVLIREAHNFVGLDDSYFRVAFRSTEGLSRLLSVLREAETAS